MCCKHTKTSASTKTGSSTITVLCENFRRPFISMTVYLSDHPCILALPVFDGLTHFNPFSFLSSFPGDF